MLRPQKTKFRKHQKGSYKKGSKNFFYLDNAKKEVFQLQTLQKARLTAKQLEAARQTIQKNIKRKNALALKVFPDIPVTRKPIEVRMGKGKGSVEFWSCSVMPGSVLFEISGLSREKAHLALYSGATKLPVQIYITG